MDILIFTPVYRLEPETVRALMNLEHDGPLSILLQRDNPSEIQKVKFRGIENHLHQYRRGREAFLAGPYDAMLVIESDIVPPPDTVTRLAALGADVAYGAYVFRDVHKVNIFEYLGGPKMGQSISANGLWASAVRQGVIPCSGAGFGCTLIQRHVLEAVPFRLGERDGYCDSFWTEDVYNAGYRMMADCNVQCNHKDPSGQIFTVRDQ